MFKSEYRLLDSILGYQEQSQFQSMDNVHSYSMLIFSIILRLVQLMTCLKSVYVRTYKTTHSSVMFCTPGN